MKRQLSTSLKQNHDSYFRVIINEYLIQPIPINYPIANPHTHLTKILWRAQRFDINRHNQAGNPIRYSQEKPNSNYDFIIRYRGQKTKYSNNICNLKTLFICQFLFYNIPHKDTNNTSQRKDPIQQTQF
ncbi:unnamed protein product [Paramecium primaurelia]|uniref:Uncharacterized protein n=1 Tax=Paramecium primaurelia TaxID=5886 RepID=A0A8S1P2Y5_PARPR|nr:unnamed protein product [Paramecium primaurelia]